MNYILTKVAAIISAAGIFATAIAGSPPRWQALLVAAIDATAVGECPIDLMEEPLRVKCVRDQAASLPQLFAQMGQLQAAHFVKVEPHGGGDVEVYRVIFERGETTWNITAGADGKKISGLWMSAPHS